MLDLETWPRPRGRKIWPRPRPRSWVVASASWVVASASWVVASASWIVTSASASRGCGLVNIPGNNSFKWRWTCIFWSWKIDVRSTKKNHWRRMWSGGQIEQWLSTARQSILFWLENKHNEQRRQQQRRTTTSHSTLLLFLTIAYVSEYPHREREFSRISTILHWLPISQRNKYEIWFLAFKQLAMSLRFLCGSYTDPWSFTHMHMCHIILLTRDMLHPCASLLLTSGVLHIIVTFYSCTCPTFRTRSLQRTLQFYDEILCYLLTYLLTISFRKKSMLTYVSWFSICPMKTIYT